MGKGKREIVKWLIKHEFHNYGLQTGRKTIDWLKSFPSSKIKLGGKWSIGWLKVEVYTKVIFLIEAGRLSIG